MAGFNLFKRQEQSNPAAELMAIPYEAYYEYARMHPGANGTGAERIDPSLLDQAVPVETYYLDLYPRIDFGNDIAGVKHHFMHSRHLDVARYMGHGNEQLLSASGEDRREGYSGRLIDISGITTYPNGKTATPTNESVSLVNLDEAPGMVVRDAYAARMEASGKHTTVKDLSYAFMLLEVDEDLPHPFTGYGEGEYDDLGDYRVVDIMTSADANPENGYIHKQRRLPIFDTDGKIAYFDTLNEYEVALLSDPVVSKEFKDDLLTRTKDWQQDGYRAVLDGLIQSVGSSFVEPGKSPDSRVSDDDNTEAEIRRVRDAYLRDSLNPMSWRLPARAWQQSLDLLTVGSRQDQQRLERIRHAMRDEIAQACGANETLDVLLEEAQLMSDLSGQPIESPLRFTMTGIDNFDQEFAKSLGKSAQRFKRPAQAGNQEHLEQVAQAVEEQAELYANLSDATLLIKATEGNNLVLHPDLNGTPTESTDKFTYTPGTTMDYDATSGAFPADMDASVYEHGAALQMDGFVTKFTVDGEGINKAKTFVVVDMLQARGRLLNNVINSGYFDGDTRILRDRPPFSALLAGRNPFPRLGLLRFVGNSPHEIMHIDNDPNKPAVFGEGEAVGISLTPDSSEVVVKRNRIVGTSGSKRLAELNLDDTYEVEQPSLDPKATQLASFVLKNSGLHFWATTSAEGIKAKTSVSVR
jgi:hypothetical protein